MPPPTGTDGGRLSEFDLIAEVFRPLARQDVAARDLEDDAAVLAIEPGHELVTTIDALVAGVHFLETDDPADIAWKALAVNLSDLAAMGADARAYVLAAAWPTSADRGWIERFAVGLGEAQDRFRVSLVGGDTVATPGPLTLAITAYGSLPAGTALPRGGARPTDRVFVTGCIGDAALGLALAMGNEMAADADTERALLTRLRRPEPRLDLGRRLRGLATAAADVSDGLVADAGHIAAASGVAIDIEAARVPVSDAARVVLDANPGRLADLLTGGDDYELLFTAPADAEEAVLAAARDSMTAVTAIGAVTARPASEVTVRDTHGEPMPLAITGYRHLD